MAFPAGSPPTAAMVNSPMALDLLATGSLDTAVPVTPSACRYSTANVWLVFSPSTEGSEPFSESDHEVLESIAPAMARLVAKVRPFYGSAWRPATISRPPITWMPSCDAPVSGNGAAVETVLLVLQARGDGSKWRVSNRNGGGGIAAPARRRHSLCVRRRHGRVSLGVRHAG